VAGDDIMKAKDLLHRYQVRGVQHIKNNLACALWMDIGTGKTITSLTAIEDLMDAGEIYGALVVAPLRICQSVWMQEAKEWRHTTRLTFSLIHGKPQDRIAALRRKAFIYLVNYENLPWLSDKLVEKYLSRGKHLPFNMVIFDEVSKMSNSTSKRVKAFLRLLPYTMRRTGLTGTPATNGLTKLHGQYLTLDGGVRLGRYKTHFESRYFESDYMGYKLVPKPGAEEEIKNAIKDITYTVDAKDYLELPEKTVVDIPIELPDEARSTYDEMEEEFFTEIAGEEIEAFNAAAKSTKCLQICNGAVYTDKTGSFTEVHDSKLEALGDIIEEMAGRPLLVCYSFRSDAERIKRRFKFAMDVREKPADEIVSAWNQGEIPLLIGHPASMGHGLNLQYGGHHIVWFGLPWDLELYDQAIGRLDRQGQKYPVFIHRLLAEDTMEDKVVKGVLAHKGNIQKALREAVKQYQYRRQIGGSL
jgi:SNF2 family DNA or RNA helicase